MIKSLRATLTALALSATVAFSAKAQSVVTSETGANSTDGVTFQRLRASVPGAHQSLRVTQDINPDGINLLSADVSSQLGPYTIDVTAYRSANMTGPQAILSEAWIVRQFGSSRIMFDVGTTPSATPGATGYDWTVIKSKLGPVGLEGALVYSFKDGERTRMTFGDVSIGNDNAFAALGYDNGTLVAFTGSRPLRNVGNITFGNYNDETGAWSFKSQTGIGNINTQVFGEGNYRFTSSYFSIPQFHPTHFGPFDTKGTTDVLLQGNGDHNSTTLTGMLGRRITNNFAAGAGITYNRNGSQTSIGIPVHATLSVGTGPLQATAEVQSDARTGKTNGYLTMRYTLGGR